MCTLCHHALLLTGTEMSLPVKDILSSSDPPQEVLPQLFTELTSFIIPKLFIPNLVTKVKFHPYFLIHFANGEYYKTR
jgi:hypothetical protein